MSEIQNKRKIEKGNMVLSIFFGAGVGAVIGLMAYVNNWLG